MKAKRALKLAEETTKLKTTNGVYLPVQLVRKDDDDMMVIVQTTAPLDKDLMDTLKNAEDVKVTVSGTFVAYE